jgi:cell division protein FtsB
MDHEIHGFVLSIIAIVMVASIVKTFIRAKYGVTVRRRRRHGGEEEVPSAARQVELLDHENAELKGQVVRLEERIAVLERIATDRSRRLADEIDSLG